MGRSRCDGAATPRIAPVRSRRRNVFWSCGIDLSRRHPCWVLRGGFPRPKHRREGWLRRTHPKVQVHPCECVCALHTAKPEEGRLLPSPLLKCATTVPLRTHVGAAPDVSGYRISRPHRRPACKPTAPLHHLHVLQTRKRPGARREGGSGRQKHKHSGVLVRFPGPLLPDAMPDTPKHKTPTTLLDWRAENAQCHGHQHPRYIPSTFLSRLRVALSLSPPPEEGETRPTGNALARLSLS